LTRDEYHDLDYQVMGFAFELHRRLGRLHDERIYHAELAHQCAARGLRVAHEVPIAASLDGFTKTYYMDLVVEDSTDYELKTAEALIAPHRGQALNYLFLSGLSHGKLINFRPPSVEHEFVTTNLTREERMQMRLEASGGDTGDALRTKLVNVVQRVIAEWGGFLDTELYRDVITYLCGGSVRPLVIASNGRELGRANLTLLDDATAMEVTSLHRDQPEYADHLRRKLACTKLRAMQWINFDRHTVALRTIK
jgi:GxxExxY protein